MGGSSVCNGVPFSPASYHTLHNTLTIVRSPSPLLSQDCLAQHNSRFQCHCGRARCAHNEDQCYCRHFVIGQVVLSGNPLFTYPQFHEVATGGGTMAMPMKRAGRYWPLCQTPLCSVEASPVMTQIANATHSSMRVNPYSHREIFVLSFADAVVPSLFYCL